MENLKESEYTSERLNQQWKDKEEIYEIKITKLKDQINIMRDGQDNRDTEQKNQIFDQSIEIKQL